MINVPYSKQQVDWLFHNNDSWAIAFVQFWTKPIIIFQQIDCCNLYTCILIFPKVSMKDPIKDAMLVFSDGSSNGRAAYVVDGKGYAVQTAPASVQLVEL